jgi:hypothetical protein
MIKPDLYWDTSPVAREHRRKLEAENERLRAAADELVKALEQIRELWPYDDEREVLAIVRRALARYREASGGE